MPKINPFEKAHYQKVNLSKRTMKEIRKAYKEAAQDIKMMLSNASYVSDSIKKAYIQSALRDVNKAIDDISKLEYGIIVDAGTKSGEMAINAGNAMMKKAGLDIKGAYSYVPKRQIENIITGGIYKTDWSLSKAIWDHGKKTKSDIERIVAKGLAENASIKDIADDLTLYVKPESVKPWDWTKVYPGTQDNIEYNAQRLARTMIQHAYQSSMCQQQMYNPFCSGIIWHSAGIHGRTCEICLDRDGEKFPVTDLPLDHPNGLCWFEPAIDDLNTVADRLADWAHGRDDYDIDQYITRGLDYNTFTPLGKMAVREVKQKYRNRLGG